MTTLIVVCQFITIFRYNQWFSFTLCRTGKVKNLLVESNHIYNKFSIKNCLCPKTLTLLLLSEMCCFQEKNKHHRKTKRMLKSDIKYENLKICTVKPSV